MSANSLIKSLSDDLEYGDERGVFSDLGILITAAKRSRYRDVSYLMGRTAVPDASHTRT